MQVCDAAATFLRVGTEIAILTERALEKGVTFHQPCSFSTMTVTFEMQLAKGIAWNMAAARGAVTYPFTERRGMANQLLLAYEGSSLMLGVFGRKINFVGVRNFDEAARALADYLEIMRDAYEPVDLEVLRSGDFEGITVAFGMVNIVFHADMRIDIGKMYDRLVAERLADYTPSLEPGKLRVTVGEPWTKTSGVVKVDVPTSGRLTAHIKGARGHVASMGSLKNIEERMLIAVRCVFDVLVTAVEDKAIGSPGAGAFPTRTVGVKKRARFELLAGYERDSFLLTGPAMV